MIKELKERKGRKGAKMKMEIKIGIAGKRDEIRTYELLILMCPVIAGLVPPAIPLNY